VSISKGSDDHPEAGPSASPSVGSSIGLLFLLVLGTGVGEVVATAVLPNTTTATTRLLVALCIAWPMVLIAAQTLQRAPLCQTFRSVEQLWLDLGHAEPAVVFGRASQGGLAGPTGPDAHPRSARRCAPRNGRQR